MAIKIIMAVLFIGGSIGAICSTFYNLSEENRKRTIISSVISLVLIICSIILPWSFRVVDNGEIAVVKDMGRAVDTREPGMHFDFCMTKSYIKLDTKVRQIDIDTSAYSHDKQTMNITMAIQYQIKKEMSMDIVRNYGNLATLEAKIQSVSIERTKSVLSNEDAASIIESRGNISAAVAVAVQEAVGESYYVVITNVSLTNIDFSDAFEQSVEQSMIARQEVERAKAEAEKAVAAAEGQIKVAEANAEAAKAQANGEAEAAKIAADAEAYAKEKAAEAEANAIAIKSLQIAKMLGLTVTVDGEDVIKSDLSPEEAKLISDYLKYAEYLSSWDGKLPEVLTDGSGIIINP